MLDIRVRIHHRYECVTIPRIIVLNLTSHADACQMQCIKPLNAVDVARAHECSWFTCADLSSNGEQDIWESHFIAAYSGAQEDWEEDFGKGKARTLDTAGNERMAE